MTDVVYGRRAVREALRGRREVGQVWCAPGLPGTLEWLPQGVREATPPQLTHRAGSPDHQGVVAEVSDYRYADAEALLAGERPLVVALDEVTDPHNLGAVARVAECARAPTAWSSPPAVRRRSRPPCAVCRPGRSSISRSPASTTWPTCCWPAKRPGLWSYAAAAESAVPYDRADYGDGAVFVLGAEGRGLRRRVRGACDQVVAIPMRGAVESLNVSTAAAVLLFEAVRQRGGG